MLAGTGIMKCQMMAYIEMFKVNWRNATRVIEILKMSWVPHFYTTDAPWALLPKSVRKNLIRQETWLS